MNIKRSGYLDQVQEHVFSLFNGDGICHFLQDLLFRRKREWLNIVDNCLAFLLAVSETERSIKLSTGTLWKESD